MTHNTILKDTTLFAITLHAWGNRRKVDSEYITAGDTDKRALSVTKRLIDADEFSSIIRFQNDVKEWCRNRSMPSFLREGIFVVKNSLVEEFDNYLTQAKNTLTSEYIPRLLSVYPDARARARQALGALYSDSDYPSDTALRSSFDIEWHWLSLSVPDDIPESVRRREYKKFQEQLQQARNRIIAALYSSLDEIVDTAIQRFSADGTKTNPLRIAPFMERFAVFISTFADRNLFNDEELTKLVRKAETVLQGTQHSALLSSHKLRQKIVEQFKQVKEELHAIIAERKIVFDE